MKKVLVENIALRHDFILSCGYRNFMVYKSLTTLETGYIYTPYVPARLIEPIENEDFDPTDSILTRYSETTVNNKFYGTVNVMGL